MPKAAKPQQPGESDEQYAARLKNNKRMQTLRGQRQRETELEQLEAARKKEQQKKKRRERYRRAQEQKNMPSSQSTSSHRRSQGDDMMSPTARSITEAVTAIASCSEKLDPKDLVQIVERVCSVEKAKCSVEKAKWEYKKEIEEREKAKVQFDQMKYIEQLEAAGKEEQQTE